MVKGKGDRTIVINWKTELPISNCLTSPKFCLSKPFADFKMRLAIEETDGLLSIFLLHKKKAWPNNLTANLELIRKDKINANSLPRIETKVQVRQTGSFKFLSALIARTVWLHEDGKLHVRCTLAHGPN